MPWTTPAEELESLRMAAARASCEVRYAAERDTPHGRRIFGRVTCPDGWAAARMLVALSLEDAATPAARSLALEIRRGAPSDAAYVRAVFDYVRSNVRFVREHGEVFARGDYTLAAGAGDCDDHARLVLALLRAGGIPSRMGFLYKQGEPGPRHVAAQAFVDGRWLWLETTIRAELGEEPNAAARRLGVVGARQDIAGEVRTMTEKDLGPLPPGFDRRTSPKQFELDCQALAGLGFLCDSSAPISPSDPEFRRAVLAFQTDVGVTRDGLIGPETRGALLEGLNGGELGMAYMAALAGAATRLTAHLEPAFFRAVREMAEDFQGQGAKASAEDFLAVWNVESGVNPAVRNGLGAPYLGINQMGPDERRSVGFTGSDEQWLGLSAVDQLAYVRKWYAAKPVHAYRDAGSVYLMTFLPALASHAGEPGYVLARRKDDAPALDAPEAEWIEYRKAHPRDWYAWNRVLDHGKKGWIEVADMRLAVEGQKHGPLWEEIRSRYYAESGDVPPSPGIGNAVATLLVIGGAATLAWWVASQA